MAMVFSPSGEGAAVSWMVGTGWLELVESAGFNAVDEGIPFGGDEEQFGAVGVFAVADRDHARKVVGDLDALSAIPAGARGLSPYGGAQVHSCFASSIIRSDACSG